MKRILILISVFVVAFSLMVIPAFAATSYTSSNAIDQFTIGFDGPIPTGRYTLRIQMGTYLDIVTDPFELRSDVELYVDGRNLYYIQTQDFTQFALFEVESEWGSLLPVEVDDVTLTFTPYLKGSEFFLENIIAVLVGVISWVGIIVHALISKDGALHSILPVFAIGISITALFFAIRAIRSFIWGA